MKAALLFGAVLVPFTAYVSLSDSVANAYDLADDASGQAFRVSSELEDVSERLDRTERRIEDLQDAQRYQ